MLYALASAQDNDTSSPQNNDTNSPQNNDTNSPQNNDTNNPQENLSPEQKIDKARENLSEAEKRLADLKEKKEQTQVVYDKHNKAHAEAQDDSDSETEAEEVFYLEHLKPYLDELEENIEKAQQHVQELVDFVSSLF